MSIEIKIPVVAIKPRGPLHNPNDGDVHGGINKSLDRIVSSALIEAGDHRLVPFIATSPHTDGSHIVFWVDNINTNNPLKVTDWEDGDWMSYATDSKFLAHLQNLLLDLHTTNDNLKIYQYRGLINGQRNEAPHILRSGLQSQSRPHIHVAEEVDTRKALRELDLGNERDRVQFGLMLNVSGEAAVKEFSTKGFFDGYGSRFTYTQRIGGVDNAVFVNRTMFGFSSLEDALTKTITLQNIVIPSWEAYLDGLKGTTFEFEGENFPHMQSPVPNMVIMVPSERDRSNGGVENKYPIWVMPLSVTGAQVLIPGGVAIDRWTPNS